MSGHRFPYKWQKKDLLRVEKHGLTAFSCFACGGGSCFGYDMAGYDVLGGNEIDDEMTEFYLANHDPKFFFNEPIQEFKKRTDLPEELYNLDVLSGSPPCSTFSMSGLREKAWGKKKKFREGQSEQVLSDLFFDYLDLVAVLKPKTVVAENVKGMLLGNARGYCKMVADRFNDLGYDVQLFLLNAASMGVPQARERVFFIARRRDLNLPALVVDFKEPPITFEEMEKNLPFQDLEGTQASEQLRPVWEKTIEGQCFSDTFSRYGGKNTFFSYKRISRYMPCSTIMASAGGFYHYGDYRILSWIELCLIGSYPYDYDFLGKGLSKIKYLIGMSVPPVMMAQIAALIAEQWFGIMPDKINKAWSE